MTEVIDVAEAVASDDDNAEHADRDDDYGVASAVSAWRSCAGSFRCGSSQCADDRVILKYRLLPAEDRAQAARHAQDAMPAIRQTFDQRFPEAARVPHGRLL